MSDEKFVKTFEQFGILCNNSCYGGDCYGDSYCTLLAQQREWRTKRHKKYARQKIACETHPLIRCRTENCGVVICGCCREFLGIDLCPKCHRDPEEDPNQIRCSSCCDVLPDTKVETCKTCDNILCSQCESWANPSPRLKGRYSCFDCATPA